MSSEDIKREFVKESREMAVARLDDHNDRMIGLRDRQVLDMVSGHAVLRLRWANKDNSFFELMAIIEHNETIIAELESIERSLDER